MLRMMKFVVLGGEGVAQEPAVGLQAPPNHGEETVHRLIIEII
jgi:hypothetical protein